MARRSHSRRLRLFMNGDEVGTWSLSPSGQELRYADSWITSPKGRPISVSLPFQPGNRELQGPAVQFFFENLLPDSRQIRERLAHRFRAASTAAVDLLAEIGRDCVGALQILPEGEEPGEIRAIRGEALSDAEVAEELAAALAGPQQAGRRDNQGLRLSIAGAQEKTALLHHQGRWLRPLGATPTTHILKLPLGLVGNLQLDLRHSVENEWLCAQILKAFGLEVARCDMARFGDYPVLIVERFDRAYVPDHSFILRLPQEDLCQATGTAADLKYEADGGPGIDQVLRLLDRSSRRQEDRLHFLKSQLLFWMLCAPDGHAKNFSIALHAGGAYSLTPLYDVMSAYPLLGKGPRRIAPHDVRLAMAVRSRNPHWRIHEILPRHWNAVAKRNSMGTAAEDLIADLIAATPGVIERVVGTLPADFPSAVSGSILQGLEKAAKKLAVGL